MGRSAYDVVDDDGNIIQPPTPDHPVMAIIYLLEYGRKRGFRIGPTVQVGDTIVQVRDTRVKEERDEREPDLQPGSDMAVLLSPE